jgi:hypothetical protein
MHSTSRNANRDPLTTVQDVSGDYHTERARPCSVQRRKNTTFDGAHPFVTAQYLGRLNFSVQLATLPRQFLMCLRFPEYDKYP